MKTKIGLLMARLRERPDTEHEQAFIRLAVGIVLFFYLLPGAFVDTGAKREADLLYLGAMVAFLAVAVGLIASILMHPGVSRVRRVLGAGNDAAATTFFLIVADVYALPLFLVYIWITLANGVRYGSAYLLASLAFSLAGFGTVLAFSPFWRDHLGIGVGMMVGMGVLALYVLTLVRRMFAALARAEAANQAKRRFISVVSHEMRTPLNAIVNMGHLLRDTPLNREQLDMVQTMSGSSGVLLGLVEDVLDFSKIEAGKLSLERIDFDLHALVNSTVKILLGQAQEKGLELTVSIMPQVTPALHGDAHHLRQVLINLIGNAIKFTEKGSVTVHVSLISESNEQARLKFSVRDTGIGIPPESQRRIFDSFAQADESTTRRFGGTGLGTTIAKQLVELMGGCMGLESAVGLGSTFWFEIDLAKQAGWTTQGVGELAEARILLIGFPEAVRDTVSEMLKGWGARPMPVATVEEAAARALREISLAPAPHSALLYCASADEAPAQLGQLRRTARLPGLPAVIAVPGDGRAEGPGSVPGGRNVVLECPIDKRLLFNALHAVSADEAEKKEVVFLADYLKRRDGARAVRVIVADDNASNRTVISKILERAGHMVTLVESGEQALDAIEQDHYDLVILDRNMPNLGGVDTLKAMRFLYIGNERLPVIMLSADVTPEAREECIEAGADAFLPKPVEAARLLDSIAELAGRQESKAPPAVPRRAALAAADAPPVLNYETIGLLEELGSDGEFMEKLISAFIKDTQQILRRLEQDPAYLPVGELRSLVHALKGSVASVGADRLTQYCTRISSLGDTELRAQAHSLARALREEFDAVRKSLSDYLAKRQRTTG